MRTVAFTLMVAAATSPLFGQISSLPAPPAWQDGASVYLSKDESPPSQAPQTLQTPPRYEPPAIDVGVATPIVESPLQPTAVPPVIDRSVEHAVHHVNSAPAPIPAQNDQQRRLAPPSVRPSNSTTQVSEGTAARSAPNFGLPWESISTMVAGLGIVVGLFLICMWLLRRGTRNTTSALPPDVVSVLGRVPLAARHVAQLLRVGNKLVLVSMTPTGAEPLTEVTDPTEVDRLVGLCQQADPHSTTKAFEQVFQQLSREPAPVGFLGQDATFGPKVPSFEPQRAYRGESARA